MLHETTRKIRIFKDTFMIYEGAAMYPTNFDHSNIRIQDFWREYRQSATFYGLPAEPGLLEKARHAAGEVLIALGSRIKPRPANTRRIMAWGGR
jgi:hypothetical protein